MGLMSERIKLTARDGVAIAGDYYLPSEESVKGLLLLHMMPADRASWRQFAEKTQEAGWHALAIDLRGHGESQGGPDGYKRFSDAEHQASELDVEAGARFLQSKGVAALSLGGASIGANLALQYLAEHPDAHAAFLLSPGLAYRGVRTDAAARFLWTGQAVFYVASRDDPYSADTVRELFEATSEGVTKAIRLFETAGHGTTIFERKPECMDEVMAWLHEH